MIFSFTEYIKRCSELILLDHLPAKSYFNGYGFPIPVYGCSIMSFNKAVILFIMALFPDFFQ